MSRFKDYIDYDAVGLAEQVADKAISPGEVLAAAMERIETFNPSVNAVVQTWFEAAERAIAEGLPEGPFTGVPMLIKDLNAPVKDTVLSNGSRLFADNRVDFDSELVARYRRSGMLLLGRTNTPEMGASASTDPVLHGPARNPWNLEHTPGGSSGGAGAAVAAGMLPAAHATDGGGSIRIPAACCGLVGLKPTRNRNPMGPHRGEGWNGLSHEHVVSRTVRDSAAILDATHGPDIGAPYHQAPPERPYLEEVGRDPGELRIALMAKPLSGAAVDKECQWAVEETARLCESLGHHVVEAAPAVDPDEWSKTAQIIISTAVAWAIGEREKQLGRPAGEDELEGVVAAIVARGRTIEATDYFAAVQTMHRIGRAVGGFFQEHDVLLSPTLAKPPLRVGELTLDTDDVRGNREAMAGFSPFTSLFNLTGQPAASVPCGFSSDGLPIGLHVVGRKGDEATILRASAVFEKMRPWADKHPPIS